MEWAFLLSRQHVAWLCVEMLSAVAGFRVVNVRVKIIAVVAVDVLNDEAALAAGGAFFDEWCGGHTAGLSNVISPVIIVS